jgi:hypothetical protein
VALADAPLQQPAAGTRRLVLHRALGPLRSLGLDRPRNGVLLAEHDVAAASRTRARYDLTRWALANRTQHHYYRRERGRTGSSASVPDEALS